jgi:hypothetical protein
MDETLPGVDWSKIKVLDDQERDKIMTYFDAQTEIRRENEEAKALVDSNELLSCPFCGSEMSREQRSNRSGNLIWMAYHPGGKNCILGGMNFDIKKWNTRTR